MSISSLNNHASILDSHRNFKNSNSLFWNLLNQSRKSHEIALNNYLPWKDHFINGNSGIINGIKTKDLTSPIMWGIDNQNRPFLAFKCLFLREKNLQIKLCQEPVVIHPQNNTTYDPLVISTGSKIHSFVCKELADLPTLKSLIKGERVVVYNNRYIYEITLDNSVQKN